MNGFSRKERKVKSAKNAKDNGGKVISKTIKSEKFKSFKRKHLLAIPYMLHCFLSLPEIEALKFHAKIAKLKAQRVQSAKLIGFTNKS